MGSNRFRGHISCNLKRGSCRYLKPHDRNVFLRWEYFRPTKKEFLSPDSAQRVYEEIVFPNRKRFNAGRMKEFEREVTAKYAAFEQKISNVTLDSLRQRFMVDPEKEKILISAIEQTAKFLRNKKIDVIGVPFTDYGTVFLVKTILHLLGQNPPIFYASVSESYKQRHSNEEEKAWVGNPFVNTPPEDILIIGMEYNKGNYFLNTDLGGGSGIVTQRMFCIATRAGFRPDKIGTLKSIWGKFEVHDPDDIYGGAFSIFFPQGIYEYYRNEVWFPRQFELDHYGFYKGYPQILEARSGKGYCFSRSTYLTPVFRDKRYDEILAALTRYFELLIAETVQKNL